MGPLLILGANLGFLGQKGSPALQASFGLANTILNITFTALNILNLDKLGIDLSVEFGKKNYTGMKKVFTQGMMTFGIYFFGVTVPLIVFSNSLLSAAGVAEENAEICSHILKLLIIPLAVELAAALLRTFCMAQGFETAFTYPGIINSVLCIITSYLLVVRLDMGLTGFMIAKLLYEFGNMSVSLFVYSKTEPLSRGYLSVAEAMDGFWSFFKEIFRFSLGSYTEMLGFEVISIYVANLHNNEQMTAYMAMINFTVTFYTFGTSISIISRTRVNILIGKGLTQTAKNYYTFTWWTAFWFGALCGIFLVGINRPWIASIYGGSSILVQEYLQSLMGVYMMIMSVELSCATGSMGAKTVGRIGDILKVNSALLIINPSAGLIVLWAGGQTFGLYSTLMTACTLGNLTYFYFAITGDWASLKPAPQPVELLPQLHVEPVH